MQPAVLSETNVALLPNPHRQSGEAVSSGLVDCLVGFRPLIEPARDRIRRGLRKLAQTFTSVPFDPVAIEESLAACLSERLLQMTARVMVLELNVARLEGWLEGDSPQQRFKSFVDRLKDPEIAGQLLSEYQVLAKQVESHLSRWSATSLEFFEHFCADWEALRSAFFRADPGRLTSVEKGAGDTHRQGRSVIILSFSGGARLVYKPRSIAVEEHYQQLLGWLNELGAEPSFRQLKVLDQKDHGWAEFVRPMPCSRPEEVERFYQRQGGYLAILYALEASDFHCENLIACGEHPMLVDLEALFQHHPDIVATGMAHDIAGGALSHSVLRIGLLPLRLGGNERDAGVDISGLGGAAGQLMPRGVPSWDRANTDEMHLVRKRMTFPGARNRPSLHGQPMNALDYIESIASGFRTTYRILLANRDEMLTLFRRFSEDEVRVIVRPTYIYATLLRESFHPDMLRCHADRATIFDRLREIAEDFPALNKVFPAEVNDLLSGDIPFFTTRPASRHLWTSTGDTLENYFAVSGEQLVERRMLGLSENDLEWQQWLIRASIATLESPAEGPIARGNRTSRKRSNAGSGIELTPKYLLVEACAIGDRLATLAFSGQGDATWLGMVLTSEREWNLLPLGTDFYDGLPGVIFFLAYLGFITRECRYSDLAKSALRTLRLQIDKTRGTGTMGAFNGWGGIIYLLAHLGTIWDSASILSESERLLEPLPELIASDRNLDIIGGSSGCALALGSLLRCRPSALATALVRMCGEHLTSTAQPAEHGVGWMCGAHATSLLTGFAHGNAGIAYALCEISAITGEPRFESVAHHALEYERSIFSPENGNWPRLSSNGTIDFATAWCHGAPGIALSRLCSPGHRNDPLIQKEIDAALANTLAHGFGGNHTLCHGDLGNADVLLHASETLSRPDLRANANKAVAEVIDKARETGWICGNPQGVESPGLMTGLAGIGYALLRFGDPARIPSILALEPPVRYHA